MQPPEKEPKTFSNRIKLRAHLDQPAPLRIEKKKKKETKRKGLYLVQATLLVRDKSGCKKPGHLSSKDFNNYKIVKIFQKPELWGHPEWERTQKRTRPLSFSFKWDKQRKGDGKHTRSTEKRTGTSRREEENAILEESGTYPLRMRYSTLSPYHHNACLLLQHSK